MGLSIHRRQEVFVVAACFNTVFDKLHGLDAVHVGQVLAKDPNALQCFLVHEQVFTTCSRGQDVDGRIDAAVGNLSVQLELHVA